MTRRHQKYILPTVKKGRKMPAIAVTKGRKMPAIVQDLFLCLNLDPLFLVHSALCTHKLPKT